MSKLAMTDLPAGGMTGSDVPLTHVATDISDI